MPALLQTLILLASTYSLPSWLSRNLERFDLIAHDFVATGRGLRTVRARRPGEVVITVPECDAVTASSILNRFPDTFERVSREQAFTDEQVMAIGLLLLRHRDDPYICSLPTRQYSVLEVPDSILKCLPRAYRSVILAYREHVETMNASLNNLLGTKFPLPDFFWAFATVRSRCVGAGQEGDCRIVTGGEKRVMLPGFDLLNHRFGACASLRHSSEEHAYVLESNDSFAEGDQVYISYGETRDHLKMIMTYGFCAPGNPNAVVFFDVVDLLHACSVARPGFFPPLVVEQLLRLNRKLGKDTELYEFDLYSHKPRKSLQIGIDMMAEIEKQFLSQPDDLFARDVLMSLLYTRKEEVYKHLERLDQIIDIDASWIHFIDSIRTLLRLELECCPM